jgi:release factor glutamine methyltransferase
MSREAAHTTHTIRSARKWGAALLAGSELFISVDVQNLEADVLLLESINRKREARVDRSWLYGHSGELLSEMVWDAYSSMVHERAAGKPLAYILGRKEFYGYEFHVNEHTLIPREETELLVNVSLDILKKVPAAIFLDIGTGSGCILLSVVLEHKKKSLTNAPFMCWAGVDTEEKALQVALRNARSYGIENEVTFIRSSLLDAISFECAGVKKKPLVIVSNPPYISYKDTMVENSVRRFEPHTALFSGDDGFFHTKTLINNFLIFSSDWEHEAHLILEIGFDQHNELLSYFKRRAPSSFMSECLNDAADIPRVLHFCKML